MSFPMNTSDSDSFSQEDKFQSSKFCSSFKFFLVEELFFVLEQEFSFAERVQKFHHGNCSVIGRFGSKTEAVYHVEYYLDNIYLPNMPSEYALPTGSVSLPLVLKTKYLHNFKNPPVGKYVEIYGEICFYHTSATKPLNEEDLLTTKNLMKVLSDRYNGDNPEAFLKRVRDKFRPVVLIQCYNLVDRPGELAEKNLEIRMILADRNQSNYAKLK